MKTKKVLALVVLAAFLISIVPFAAFAVDAYNSSIDAPTGTVPAVGTPATDSDGAEFDVVIVGDGPIYVASSRPAATSYYYKLDSKWYEIPFYTQTGAEGTEVTVLQRVVEIDAAKTTRLGDASSTARALELKVVSTAAGRTNIAFGLTPTAARDYALSRDYQGPSSDDISKIIGGNLYPVEFDAPAATKVTLSVDGIPPAQMLLAVNQKPANNVDTYTLVAYVTTDNNVPVAGKDVQFNIISGTGASLTASKATTSASGKAEVKIYSQRDGKIEVRAKIGNKTGESSDVDVIFKTPGIVSIKAESDNNQKVARNNGTKTFKFSAYDANGNRVKFADKALVTKTVVTKPSGSNFTKDNGFVIDDTNADGYGRINIDTTKLGKDGEYEVKIHLANGSSVSYKFSSKEQGDVTEMKLKYGSSSYAADSKVPMPKIEYLDAEGYSVEKDYKDVNSAVKLSLSDASFMTSDGMSELDGSFTLKEDKTGVLTMTAVDTVENLVATQVLTIQKAASYLKLTPQSVGAVGGEVTVKIELVDVDGQQVATGNDAFGTPSATIIAKPQDSIVSASSVDASDFAKGKAEVKVSSNVEGDVSLQVIIIEDAGTAGTAKSGKVYTGACTVSFGKASEGAGQLIFIIGSPSFVSGNKVYASESPSFIDSGRTFLGVRDMGTAIGATVEWDQASQTASLSKDGITVKVTVGASKIAVTKNGVTSEIEIDAPAQNKNGRVYLPFRAVLEAFNYTVAYDQATNSIVCTL